MAIQRIVMATGLPLPWLAMRPRARVYLLVAGAAVLAVGVVLGVTLATRQRPSQPQRLPGRPPVPSPLDTPVASRIRAAYRAWPHGTIDSLERLAAARPRDADVQLSLGLALVYAGYDADAQTALRAAKNRGRDTPVEV